ncbi:MAG: DMT family transporter [Acidobacteriota bacterium]
MTTHTPRASDWRAYGALLVAVLGISWSAVLVRWAAIPGPASGFYRVLIAAAVLVPWRLARGATRAVERRAVLLALAGGAFFAFDIALFNTAVLRTSAATATLLGNNAPVFVGFGTWLFLRRRPPAAFWIGLGLALGGCALIVAADLFSPRGSAAADVTGDLFALSCAVFWAAYMVTTEHVRAEMDTLTFSTLAITGSVLTLFVVCLLLRVPLAGYSGRTWASLLGLGVISQLVAYFALVYALGHLPATVTSVGVLAQVPLTALIAVPALGERIAAAQIAGGALVLAGIYVVNRPAK